MTTIGPNPEASEQLESLCVTLCEFVSLCVTLCHSVRLCDSVFLCRSVSLAWCLEVGLGILTLEILDGDRTPSTV